MLCSTANLVRAQTRAPFRLRIITACLAIAFASSLVPLPGRADPAAQAAPATPAQAESPPPAVAAPPTSAAQPPSNDPAQPSADTKAAAEPASAEALPAQSAQLSALQGDLKLIRAALDQLLERERMLDRHEAWVAGMQQARARHRLGPMISSLLAGAGVTALCTWGTIRTEYEGLPIVGLVLSASLTVAAAVGLGKIVHKRRAIEAEIERRPRPKLASGNAR